MAAQLSTSLSSLLPTLSPLPGPLTELATSLVAQSRTRASSLKPEEEIARIYACCHIACERLGKKLSLEIGKPYPPCPLKVYAKLKTYLGSVLRTPVTPRGRRVVGEVSGSGNGGVSGVKAVDDLGKGVGGDASAGRILRGTPSKRPAPAVEVTPSKRAARSPATATGKKVQPSKQDEPPVVEAEAPGEQGEDDDIDMDEDHEPTPVKRPAKTPLRRKEKHAKRVKGLDEGEDVGAAGLLPGLGTMFQPAVDWLSDERRADFEVWVQSMRQEMANMPAQQGSVLTAT
ncbi:hypothetical protein LTR53_016892 [Teratosphaeriaceae sp. CCFEE 6253]|nr:hypothetical protein LTR53_016892 [Teratosphaeriaceae sp. CCFEE 6253]